MGNFIPDVNSYRMGIRRPYRGTVEGAIDQPGEQKTADKFAGVKGLEERLARNLRRLDNSYLDSDPRPGRVERYRDEYEPGTGNFVSERTVYRYNPVTGEDKSLRSQGYYHTFNGIISATKAVSWDEEGRAAIDERRDYQDMSGWTVGRESVVASEHEEGIDYAQNRSGILFQA